MYRRRFPANCNPLEVALYISLFPQLVAGPIVRYGTVARQLHARRHTFGRASAGARIFIIGLAQKVLVADPVAHLVEIVFDQTKLPTLPEAWTGLLVYTVQIYFDFAGYSNMAVGLGLILGFTFPRNFRLPYSAQSITEFWRRWHMSLSSWLRDYLYIPLGGNRGGALVYLPQPCHRVSVVRALAWRELDVRALGRLAWCVPGCRTGRSRQGAAAPAAAAAVDLRAAGGDGRLGLFGARDIVTAKVIFASLVGWHGVRGISFDLHAALQPDVVLPLLAGCALAVLPRWIGRPALWLPGMAVADGVWTFGLLVLAMLSVPAGVYSPFLYFRF